LFYSYSRRKLQKKIYIYSCHSFLSLASQKKLQIFIFATSYQYIPKEAWELSKKKKREKERERKKSKRKRTNVPIKKNSLPLSIPSSPPKFFFKIPKREV
jgi:hypothetical protein